MGSLVRVDSQVKVDSLVKVGSLDKADSPVKVVSKEDNQDSQVKVDIKEASLERVDNKILMLTVDQLYNNKWTIQTSLLTVKVTQATH